MGSRFLGVFDDKLGVSNENLGVSDESWPPGSKYIVCLEECGCMRTDICGFEFVDLSFGVSCPYGEVRCCKSLQVSF